MSTATPTPSTPELARRRVRLQLAMATQWERIESVREAVSLFLGAGSRFADASAALSMVTAELLENAVKYGKVGVDDVWFTLEEGDGQIILTVENAVDQSVSLDRLDERLAWIGGFADPADAYMAAMQDIFAQAESKRPGGLGLVRVAHEGGCRLERDREAVGWVRIRAIYAIPDLDAAHVAH